MLKLKNLTIELTISEEEDQLQRHVSGISGSVFIRDQFSITRLIYFSFKLRNLANYQLVTVIRGGGEWPVPQ